MASRRRQSTNVRTVIKNYGLMWRRDAVHWGRGSNRGTLNGRRSGKIIDFRGQIGVWNYGDSASIDTPTASLV